MFTSCKVWAIVALYVIKIRQKSSDTYFLAAEKA